MTDISTLQSKIDQTIAGLGERIEAGVIAIRADELAKKRISILDNALNVRDKISIEYDKQNKPDSPPVFDPNDRKVMLQKPGVSAARVKTLKKMEERLKRLETDLELTLASHATLNALEIANAYAKLAKTTDEVSRGGDDNKPDASDSA
jgi:hypothetical protein